MNIRIFAAALLVGFTAAANAQLFRQGASQNLTASNITASGFLKLSGQTNRLTIAGGALKLDGSSVGGSSGTAGTVINSVAESGLLSVDATKTNGIAATPAHVASALSAGESSTVLKYTSGLADNATNVAMILNFSATQTDNEASFITGQNNGTNTFHLSPEGRLSLGRGFGFTHDRGDSTVLIHSLRSLVDVDPEVYLSSIWDDNWEVEAFAYLQPSITSPTSLQSRVRVGVFNGDGSSEWAMTAKIGGQGSSLIYEGLVALQPEVDDGTTPYTFDTSIAHTSGNLLEQKNNGTIKLAVPFNGSLITQGGTAITPANASATGVAGTFVWDSGFLYLCVAENTWKRVAIATW